MSDDPQPADEPAEHDGVQADLDLDLDRIDADLAGVERALGRLDDGSYWTDEVTGEPIDAAVLDTDPTATRTSASA